MKKRDEISENLNNRLRSSQRVTNPTDFTAQPNHTKWTHH